MKTRLLALLVLVLTFGAGAGFGVAADRVVLLRQGRMLPRPGLRLASDRIVKILDRKLELSPQQETNIQAILEAHRAKVEQSWASVEPQLRQELTRANMEIERELRPEQRDEYRELRRSWERRAKMILGR